MSRPFSSGRAKNFVQQPAVPKGEFNMKNSEKTMEKIKAYPVKPINDHWFSLPDGTRIELKLLANWKVND